MCIRDRFNNSEKLQTLFTLWNFVDSALRNEAKNWLQVSWKVYFAHQNSWMWLIGQAWKYGDDTKVWVKKKIVFSENILKPENLWLESGKYSVLAWPLLWLTLFCMSLVALFYWIWKAQNVTKKKKMMKLWKNLSSWENASRHNSGRV